jgi:hypothetical protein
MQSQAKTVAAYLAELPAERRAAVSQLRAMIRKHLPKGFAEVMSYGMIGYVVPHKLYPAGYHCDPKLPLPFAGLASQKNHMSLYLMTAYQDSTVGQWLREQFTAQGKKLDMGKCCLRFKKLGDLPLDVIGEAIGKVSVAAYIIQYEDSLKLSKARKKK